MSVLILAGCTTPLPLSIKRPDTTPTPIPTPAAQVTWWQVTPTPAETATSDMATPVPMTISPTPPAPARVFENALVKGTPYAYADNQGFHGLSVYVGNSRMTSGFYYTPGEPGTPAARWEASPGNKFLIVGVDFYMTGLRKEGKSSIFMTPLAASFELVKGASSYGVLNASGIPHMTDYYIRDVGSMYRDRYITKDDDGSGVLIFEVPQPFDPAGAYVTFCPRNPAATTAYYRSPDNWDCDEDLVVWKLR